MISCTDSLATSSRLRKTIQTFAPTNDAPLSQNLKSLESSLERNVAHNKFAQELIELEAAYPQLESAFEQAMDDYEAQSTFGLLRQIATSLTSSLACQRVLLKMIAPMEDYLATELPATITQ